MRSTKRALIPLFLFAVLASSSLGPAFADDAKEKATEKANPMLKGLRVGDEWVSKRTILHPGAPAIHETLTERISAIEKGSIRSEIETLWRGKAKKTHQKTVLEKTLKGQLLAAFRKEGKVELEAFSVQPQTFVFQGKELVAEKVVMAFFWTVNNKRERFDITLIRSDAVPGIGDLSWTIIGERYRIEIVLQSYKRGPKQAG